MKTAFVAMLSMALACVPMFSMAETIPCEENGYMIPICGVQAPEDLVLTDGGRFLLFSSYVAGGGLGVLDSSDDSVQVYTAPYGLQEQPGAGWGAADCPGPVPEDLLTHGIDLSQRADGRWQLLVVNHGGREAVEFFEVLMREDEPPLLEWRGCAVAPENGHFNDVVALPEGGFLVTHMFDSQSLYWGMAKTYLGLDSGVIYQWSEEDGYQALEPTRSPFPNGLALAADGEHLFVNAYASGEVRKYRRPDYALVGSAEVPGPDNSNWAANGQLLIASHRISLGNMFDAMPAYEGGPAMLHFVVVALDPETMETREIFEHQGPPLGAVTAVEEAGDYLYMGSYLGERMAKVPLSVLRW